MCGIAGLITQNPEARIGAMLKAIEHRGRDDEGVWTSPAISDEGQKVCFGHRRLSIIDTSSAGHQPMVSHDGRLVDASGLTVEDFGLTDNLMMIHALDLHGCALVTPRQAPADIWHDLTAFESCVRMAAERTASAPARASS